MFKFTSIIFFGLLDLIISAILIGIGIVALAIIIFVVSEIIKAMLTSKTTDTPNDK